MEKNNNSLVAESPKMTSAEMCERFTDDWDIVGILGEGAFGQVKLLKNNKDPSSAMLAVKIIDFVGNRQAEAQIKREMGIMKLVRHKNVLRYVQHRLEFGIYYIFLEYADGGELFDRIEPDVGMKPELAQKYFRELIAGLEFLHRAGVAHRDLKPENLLLAGAADVLKISDFGLATVFRRRGVTRKSTSRCGTLPYVAPEVLICNQEGYDVEPGDVWSCGIILVALLAGELPWDRPIQSCSSFANWIEKRNLDESPWSKIKTVAMSLIKSILNPDPSQRTNISGIKQHQWFIRNIRTQPSFACNGSLAKRAKLCEDSNVHSASQPNPRPQRMNLPKRHDNVVQSSGRRDLSSKNDTKDDTYNQCRTPTIIGSDGEEESGSRRDRASCSSTTTTTGLLMDRRIASMKSDEAPMQQHSNDGSPKMLLSFSQPTNLADSILLDSQSSQTQEMNALQLVVRRMTRFCVRTTGTSAVEMIGDFCTNKFNMTVCWINQYEIKVSCESSESWRKPVQFKVVAFTFPDKVMVDFRRIQGDGLDFKRKFRLLREECSDIICMESLDWLTAKGLFVKPHHDSADRDKPEKKIIDQSAVEQNEINSNKNNDKSNEEEADEGEFDSPPSSVGNSNGSLLDNSNDDQKSGERSSRSDESVPALTCSPSSEMEVKENESSEQAAMDQSGLTKETSLQSSSISCRKRALSDLSNPIDRLSL